MKQNVTGHLKKKKLIQFKKLDKKKEQVQIRTPEVHQMREEFLKRVCLFVWLQKFCQSIKT